MSDRNYRHNLEAQLAMAHEAIDGLRHENDHLRGAARHVLINHNDCVCRHTRRALKDALLVGEAIPDAGLADAREGKQ